MNWSQKILRQVKLIVVACIITTVIVSIIPFFLICILIRGIVVLCAKISRPDLEGVLKAEHASFARGSDNYAMENIIVTFTLKGQVPLETMLISIQKRVFDSVETQKKFKLLKRTFEDFGGWSFWKCDREFDLRNHIRNYDYKGRLAISNPCCDKDLFAVLPDLFQAPWNRKQSPWEMLRVDNYQFKEENCTALILRMDHALGDGFSIYNFMKTFSRSEFLIPKLKFNERKFGLLGKLGLVFRVPYDVARNLENAFSATGLLPVRPLEKGEVISVNPIVSVETIKTIKNHFKVNYAAVIYAATCGAIERALKLSKQDPPEWLKGGFIIPKRNHPGGICIHVSTTVTAWPIKSICPVERLFKIQQILQDIANSTVSFAYDNVACLFGSGPQFFGRFVSQQGKGYCDRVGLGATLTNFPVSTSPDYFEGHEVLDLTLGISTIEPSGLIADTGGINNVQRFNFNIQRKLFASDEICKNMGNYALEELHALLGSIA